MTHALNESTFGYNCRKLNYIQPVKCTDTSKVKALFTLCTIIIIVLSSYDTKHNIRLTTVFDFHKYNTSFMSTVNSTVLPNIYRLYNKSSAGSRITASSSTRENENSKKVCVLLYVPYIATSSSTHYDRELFGIIYKTRINSDLISYLIWPSPSVCLLCDFVFLPLPHLAPSLKPISGENYQSSACIMRPCKSL